MGLVDALPETYLPRERISASFKVIDPVHGVIHDGTHFTGHYYTSTGSAVVVAITAPAASTKKDIHFVAGVETNKAALWYFCKGSVGTAISGGTVVTTYNNYQESTITDPALVLKDVSVTTLGTVLETHIIGGADTNQSKTGGGVEARNEWVLESGATYFLYVVPDAAATRVMVNLPYYYREHE